MEIINKVWYASYICPIVTWSDEISWEFPFDNQSEEGKKTMLMCIQNKPKHFKPSLLNHIIFRKVKKFIYKRIEISLQTCIIEEEEEDDLKEEQEQGEENDDDDEEETNEEEEITLKLEDFLTDDTQIYHQHIANQSKVEKKKKKKKKKNDQ